MTDGRVSADRYNRILKLILERYDHYVELFVKELMASGHPPFTEKVTPYAEYQKLVAMRDAGDPNYVNDPRAQARLAELAVRFGQPGPLTAAQPFGTQIPVRPSAELGASLTAGKLGPPPIFPPEAAQ